MGLPLPDPERTGGGRPRGEESDGGDLESDCLKKMGCFGWEWSRAGEEGGEPRPRPAENEGLMEGVEGVKGGRPGEEGNGG